MRCISERLLFKGIVEYFLLANVVFRTSSTLKRINVRRIQFIYIFHNEVKIMLKIMFVDDEINVINGLTEGYDWESLGFEVVATATST